MECPDGEAIRVIEANYGRKRRDMETCNTPFQDKCDMERKLHKRADCPMTETELRLHVNSKLNTFDENVYCAREKMEFFEANCNHRQTCTIKEINRESMGIGKKEDFCGKEKRYAIVEYRCGYDKFQIKEPVKLIPAGEPEVIGPKFDLSNPMDKEIVAQKFAKHPEGEVEVANPHPHAIKAKQFKEVTVGNKKVAIACDKDEMYLRCPKDQYIKLVTANYGRKKGDMETCNKNFQDKCDAERKHFKSANCPRTVAELKYGFNHDLNVFDPDVFCAQEVVEFFRQSCEGKTECSIEQISRDVMKISYGINFCGSETKYAIVEYHCVKRV